MIKKIMINKPAEEVDQFLEGGTPKPKKAKAKPEPTIDETESSSGESEPETSSDESSVSEVESVKSVRSSTLTIDMLAGDPLFVVLSHFLTCSSRGPDGDGDDDENIVTVLKKISVSLEKIASAKTSSATA